MTESLKACYSELKQAIAHQGYVRRNLRFEEPFVLSSGEKTYDYIDAKAVLCRGNSLCTFSHWVSDIMDIWHCQCVGGPSISAALAVGAVLQRRSMNGKSTIGFVVRNERKGHGLCHQVEGVLIEGQTVVLVEDIITTGTAVQQAAQLVEERGAKVAAICCLVDREAGGVEYLRNLGYVVYVFTTLSEIRNLYDEAG